MCVQEGHKEWRQEHDHHLVQLHRTKRREPGDARVRGARDRDRHGARREPKLQPAHRHDRNCRRQEALALAALRRRAALQVCLCKYSSLFSAPIPNHLNTMRKSHLLIFL